MSRQCLVWARVKSLAHFHWRVVLLLFAFHAPNLGYFFCKPISSIMASRTSKPNRGGGKPNSNSRQSSQSHPHRPWRERSPAAPFQGDHQSSAICEDNRTDSTTTNNINSSREFILSRPHYAQPHYTQPHDVYYYTSYATVPLQSTPPPAAAHYMINNSYHSSLLPTMQTSIPAPRFQRPSNQPQSSGIWRTKNQGKVVKSEEHAVKSIGQGWIHVIILQSICLVSSGIRLLNSLDYFMNCTHN